MTSFKDNLSGFVFESTMHQRYENGSPVLDLQVCPRTITIEENTLGCKGYDLRPYYGYIVRMENGDTGMEQMAAKPMIIQQETSSSITLRGYKVSAMTPFGYQDIDLKDYGLTINFQNGEAKSCILHMYDRCIDIEYLKSNDSKPISIDATRIIHLSTKILNYDFMHKQVEKNECQDVLCDITRNSPKALTEIPDNKCKLVGIAFYSMLGRQDIQDDDDLLQDIGPFAFYILTRAIESSNEFDFTLHQMRVSVMCVTRWEMHLPIMFAFGRRFPHAFSPSVYAFHDDGDIKLEIMMKYDFKRANFISPQGLVGEFFDICAKIEATDEEGYDLIMKTTNYIESKLLANLSVTISNF